MWVGEKVKVESSCMRGKLSRYYIKIDCCNHEKKKLGKSLGSQNENRYRSYTKNKRKESKFINT